jgi:uroporphyrinogen decarboxylase
MLGDDIATQHGMMLSPAQWRLYLKPRLAKLISAARSVRSDIPVFYHSDGNCSDVIEDLIEVGVTILNPVQPECLNVGDLKHRYGERIAFWGTIGIQSTLPFASPEEVKKVIRERIKQFDKTGLVLGPTHVIEPEVPWENIVSFVEAIKEYD